MDKGTTPVEDWENPLKDTLPRLTWFVDVYAAVVLQTVLILIPLFWYVSPFDSGYRQ